MEREKDARAIQGGGTGEGFQEPSQLSECTAERNQAIIDDIEALSRNSVYTEHLFDSADNNDAEIWTASLNLRIDAICQQGIGASRNTVNACTSERSTGTVRSAQDCVSLMREEIPALPKSIEELVQVWRYGDESSGFKAVRLFATPDKRRCLIPQYKDRIWRQSGNKRKFERMQEVVRYVSECNPNISDVYQAGSNAEWERAVSNFKEKWGVSIDTRLTPLVKRIKRENKS